MDQGSTPAIPIPEAILGIPEVLKQGVECTADPIVHFFAHFFVWYIIMYLCLQKLESVCLEDKERRAERGFIT